MNAVHSLNRYSYLLRIDGPKTACAPCARALSALCPGNAFGRQFGLGAILGWIHLMKLGFIWARLSSAVLNQSEVNMGRLAILK